MRILLFWENHLKKEPKTVCTVPMYIQSSFLEKTAEKSCRVSATWSKVAQGRHNCLTHTSDQLENGSRTRWEALKPAVRGESGEKKIEVLPLASGHFLADFSWQGQRRHPSEKCKCAFFSSERFNRWATTTVSKFTLYYCRTHAVYNFKSLSFSDI